MSKNFELLQNISSEKDPFQTLDGWEDADAASTNAEPEAAFDATARARTEQRSELPDVFQTVYETLGPLDLVTPDLRREPEPAHRPIEETLEKKTYGETQGGTHEGSFPISRNPITRLSSDLDIPQAWLKPEIGRGPSDEVEVELEPELPSIAAPEWQPSQERAVGPSDEKVQEPSPAKEEKKQHEAPRPGIFQDSGADKRKSSGESRTRKGRTRHAYRDPRREAIAREEELKLVQRIFLAEENSPGVVLFSGFERDTGCASICIRAGEILATQAEGSVCLVDMGFRAPSLHEYCDAQNDRGLAEALAESSPIAEFAQQLSPGNLWLIASGRSAPELNFSKAADRLRARLEELRKAFRHVVIHSGALWPNAEAMLISKWTDGVVLILEAHSTRRDTARRIKESLAVANAKVLGVVLNNRTYPIPETLYSRL